MELLGCPFCGVVPVKRKAENWYYAVDHLTGCFLDDHTDYGTSVFRITDDDIAQWNNRSGLGGPDQFQVVPANPERDLNGD